MALSPARRGPSSGRLWCHHPGRWQKEEEQESRSSRAASWCLNRCSSDWGARTRAANARDHRVATVARALSTQMSAIVSLTAARSRSLRSASADDVSRAPRMALLHLLASGLARRRPPAATRLPPRRSWGTNPQLVS